MGELFQMVISHFQSPTQYQKFAKECEKEYDVKIYNLPKFTSTYARNVYNDLDLKYREKTLRSNPNGWYQNERRLYVWFILCFMQVKMLEATKFVDSNEKYWRNVSETFWHKEIYFLKYQLLNLLKAKGRTVWKDEEDNLLRKVVAKFPPKEWNEIAKEFYHLSDGEFFKTPKQCRQRWQNHLNDNIRKGTWSVEEDLTIFKFIAETDRKAWAKIVPMLEYTRTEHMIKNRFKSLTTKAMLEKGISQQEAVAVIIHNLQRKQEIGIQEEEVSQIIEDDSEEEQPERKNPTQPEQQQQQPIRNSLHQQKQPFDLFPSMFPSPRGDYELKIVTGMESSMMPSFMGRPILMDESMRSNPSLCSPIHILINNSNHFYSSITSNFFPPKDERHERLFFQNDSLRSTRNPDAPHNPFNADN